MARLRLPLVFGQGLDRATGALAVDPATFADLRNVWLREQKAKLRTGLTPPANASPLGGTSDVVAILTFRTIRGCVQVGYNRTTRVLSVWRADGRGEFQTHVGDWATLPVDAPLPVVVGAESYGKLFLAHAEQLYNYRAQTIYFDPTLTPGSQLVPLQADLDGGGLAPVRFRGVKSFLNYLVGYGFGTASDQNRPEIIRISEAGNPTIFPKQHYFVAGVREEPLTALGVGGGPVPGNSVLYAFKRGNSFRVLGTDPSTFSIVPYEDLYGCVGDRALITVGNDLYFWSEHGPRVTGPGASFDLGIPLERDADAIPSLTAPGFLAHTWTLFEPQERVVIFGVPDLTAGPKTLCYACSIRQPGVIRWSYLEFRQLLYSAALVIEGSEVAGQRPTAWADNVSGVDAGVSGTGRQATIAWDNNALAGGEVVEIWARHGASAWALLASVAATGASQNLLVSGFQALFANVELALRHTKGGLATSGYESADPDEWTAGTAADSKATFTTSAATPTIAAAVWSRVSASTTQIAFSWVQPEAGLSFVIEHGPDGVAWATAATIPASGDPRTYNFLTDPAHLATERYYRIRPERGATAGTFSAPVVRWIGPDVTPAVLDVIQTLATSHFDVFLDGAVPSSTLLRVDTSPDGATGWVTQYNQTVLPAVPFAAHAQVASPIALDSVTYYRLTYGKTAFGIQDWGRFTATGSIRLTATAPGAAVLTDGEYEPPADIRVEYTAPSPFRGLLFYRRASDDLTGITEVAEASTEQVLTPTIPFFNVFVQFEAPPLLTTPVKMVLVDTSISRRRVGAEDTADVVTTLPAPSNVTVTPAGIGQILVKWDNGQTGDGLKNTQVYWRHAVSPTGWFQLGAAVLISGPDDDMQGPQIGKPALPSSGTDIVVRVIHADQVQQLYSAVDFPYTV